MRAAATEVAMEDVTAAAIPEKAKDADVTIRMVRNADVITGKAKDADVTMRMVRNADVITGMAEAAVATDWI